ncbi:DUF3060 domain-containing protein [Curtobacterium sp. 458]|uniref:DUF3060 domain-containing protein n=1 Tax=Curtobacterium sp. 458 TaxID=3050069 RepID=UPI0025B42057|nr:DUF3060 domain-containing protein [Curtobacterium sp. 458]WJY00580.1 DUF3060 domain-containing protein [Curtobacterium sp. 458]
MRTLRMLAPTIVAAALVAVLAGCSAADSTEPASKRSTSASSKPSVLPQSDVRVPDVKKSVTCTDGTAVVDQSGAEVTLDGDCARVTVSGNDSIVHLGDVDELIVESAISRIMVGTAKTVTLSGNANDVLYTGGKPTRVTDKGERNIVQAEGK